MYIYEKSCLPYILKIYRPANVYKTESLHRDVTSSSQFYLVVKVRPTLKKIERAIDNVINISLGNCHIHYV